MKKASKLFLFGALSLSGLSMSAASYYEPLKSDISISLDSSISSPLKSEVSLSSTGNISSPLNSNISLASTGDITAPLKSDYNLYLDSNISQSSDISLKIS